jgi:hypothetical protein
MISVNTRQLVFPCLLVLKIKEFDFNTICGNYIPHLKTILYNS